MAHLTSESSNSREHTMSWDLPAQNDFIEKSSYSPPGAIVASMPWAVGGWMKQLSASNNVTFHLGIGNGSNVLFGYMSQTNVGDKGAVAQIQSTNTRAYLYSTVGAWDTNWHHCIFCFPSIAGTYVVWIDGVAVTVSQSSSGTPVDFTPNDLYWEITGAAGHFRVAEDFIATGYTITQDDADLMAGTNIGGNNTNAHFGVGNFASPLATATFRGWLSNLKTYHNLLNGSSIGTGGFSDGRNDQIGANAYSTVGGTATVNAGDHPSPMVYDQPAGGGGGSVLKRAKLIQTMMRNA